MRDRTPKMLTFPDWTRGRGNSELNLEASGCPWNSTLYSESPKRSIPFTYLYGFPRQTGSPAKGYPAYPKLNVIPAGRSAGGVEEPACFDEPPDIDSEPARSY